MSLSVGLFYEREKTSRCNLLLWAIIPGEEKTWFKNVHMCGAKGWGDTAFAAWGNLV